MGGDEGWENELEVSGIMKGLLCYAKKLEHDPQSDGVPLQPFRQVTDVMGRQLSGGSGEGRMIS